jgi:hypothetical protein
MDGLIVSVPLKDKHTGTFVVGRVILHDDSGSESGQNVVDEKVIVCQLVVPMIRDLHLPSGTSSRIRSSVRLIAPRYKTRHGSQTCHRICGIPSIQGLSISNTSRRFARIVTMTLGDMRSWRRGGRALLPDSGETGETGEKSATGETV